MYFYAAFGLKIQSEILLSELWPWDRLCDESPDISIRIGTVPTLALEAREEQYVVQIGLNVTEIYSRAAAAVSIRAGAEIVVEPMARASETAIRLFLIGPSLSMALHQRGNLVLHGSALAFPTISGGVSAVSFLGDSGQGKSTLAGALAARGAQLVSDDATAIPGNFREISSDPLIPAGYPALKLWRDAADHLETPPESRRRLFGNEKGLGRDLCQMAIILPQTAFPLRRLYLLEYGDEIATERLRAQEAHLAVLRNTYWVNDLPEPQRMAHFHQCAALVERLPVYRLRRPRRLELLQEVAKHIEHENSQEL